MKRVGIVLGAGVGLNEILPLNAENRVKKSIERYSEDCIDSIIASGGGNESEVMAKYIIAAGISWRDVYKENEARSTVENFYLSKIKFLENSECRDVEAYTQDWHAQRTLHDGRRVLGSRYTLDVIPTLDGRLQSEIERDKKLEGIKFVKDIAQLDLLLYPIWPHELKMKFGKLEQIFKDRFLGH